MTELTKTRQPSRPRFSTSQLAWLIVAGALLLVGLFYAVIAPLITANPTGIPLGTILILTGAAITVVVLRANRA